MKRAAILVLVLLTVFSVYMGVARAEDEVIYVSGMVTGYAEGRSITVDDGGKSYSFKITEDTEVVGEVKSGVIVDVEGQEGYAIYIEVTGDVEEEPVE
jgi:hypothetical protein